ncbi:MAG: imidazole glycerol phosphate synthase subunit HisH [Acidobacteria bacterium]|nr:imidazole glycerol phosphate synthase subunit HisH [Acidobacteriota bacterium]
MITVIDYGAGNLRSVENGLRYLGVPYQLTSQAADVARAKAILLPGVGHFGQMMRSLQGLDIVAPLRSAIGDGVPYLGICLGMQALFEGSEEASSYEGLRIFPGVIRRFPEGLPHACKVPHMGWNQLQIAPRSRLFEGIPAAPFVYFAHSYYLPAEENSGARDAAALCEYGGPFVAAMEHENIFGVQFHPEKSGEIGLRVVANFARLCSETAGGERAGGERAG